MKEQPLDRIERYKLDHYDIEMHSVPYIEAHSLFVKRNDRIIFEWYAEDITEMQLANLILNQFLNDLTSDVYTQIHRKKVEELEKMEKKQ